MNLTYLYISLALVVVIIIGCNSKSNTKNNNTNDDSTQQMKVHKLDNNPYEGLRNQAFSITPEQIGITLDKSQTKVYGVIMDWNVGDGVVTLVSFLSGDASMYLSSGGAVIGGGQHINIKNAALSFIHKSESDLKNASESKTNELPGNDVIKFYLLTNNGRFELEEKMENIENKSSTLSSLFEEANKVITELRLTSGN
ncbi:MAG: hypothetical protein JST82_10845 [Bacteroidetes bacterium]|nr:hypothetical protein [Bacteroidota bacterium]